MTLVEIKITIMKRASTILFCILLYTGIFLNKTNAQCLNQVSHIIGTQMVNGTSVTVTSSGTVDTNTVYCPSVTAPYLIGAKWATFNGDGSYTFHFSPAIDSLTLNFSGISNIGTHHEVVVLTLNGTHYPVSNIGSLNGCDSLAAITSSGNIVGCSGCSVSGWSNTTILGPITSLSVLDSVISGSPGGAIFSLYICNSRTIGIHEDNRYKLNMFPNPVADLLTIQGINIQTANINMIDILGQKMIINPILKTNQISIDCSNLSAGIYFILIESDGLVETKKIIIRKSH